jgi:aminoglycoside phosphotransferase family enzyme/predicted kinase
MELAHLIDALSQPAAYAHSAGPVEVHQTHISVVFLKGDFAYKIKKPVSLGFLDFRTLEKRRHYCEEEVRLNRRLAPHVYLGVVPVTQTAAGPRMEGEGGVVEWAVKMRRLPEDATLEHRLQRGEIRTEHVQALARKVAEFHARAETNAAIAAFGRFDVVAGNSRENFEQSLPQVGVTVSRAVFDRLRVRAEESLTRLRPLIEQRAWQKVPRDTHGDLRLEHVYLFPEAAPPEDLVIIDCIEFNERFRFADPVADMAFLVMDLTYHGRRDLAQAFAEAYIQASGDAEGRELLAFYTAYRATVRAKVEGFKSAEKEVPECERAAALAGARAHWLLALAEMEPPKRRPALVLVGGLPGTGKSTLARNLAEHGDFQVIRSDVVRKELAHAGGTAAAGFQGGIYTPEWTEWTYAECLRLAEQVLFEGRRVIVDATFREENKRAAFLQTATNWGVPGVLLLCHAEPGTVQARLGSRQGDASDADWTIFQHAAAHWEAPGPAMKRAIREVTTDGSSDQAFGQAAVVLREFGLVD